MLNFHDYYFDEINEHTQTLLRELKLKHEVQRYNYLLDRILEECQEDPCRGGLAAVDLILEFREEDE